MLTLRRAVPVVRRASINIVRWCGEPAWAAEARKKYEEEQRRRAARKAQVEQVDLANEVEVEDELQVEDASHELPVVEDDGWLLWQNHDACPSDMGTQWNPSSDDIAGGGIRSVEEAKFHCIKNGYGGFTQKWSLIYYFKSNTPRRLTAARQHVKKDEKGMLHLYVAPTLDGVTALTPELDKRLKDAIAAGTAPVKKDMDIDLDDDDEDWDIPEDLKSLADNAETEKETGEEKPAEAASQNKEEEKKTTAGQNKEEEKKTTAGQNKEEEKKTTENKKQPVEKQPWGHRKVGDGGLFAQFGGMTKKEQKDSAKPSRTHPARKRPVEKKPPLVKNTPQVQKAPVQPKPEQDKSTNSLLPKGSPVVATIDIKVKGATVITAGTQGVVKGATKADRMHVEFSRRVDGKNPNLNVTMKEVTLL
eukprot:TRINITY_DN4013_c0_g1_i1.p1 TRINITY_DN4013_c0_g1~~TRINITY_DN4013_c0_g1_i1.p1  ORF type:complete len:418 (+),score=130.99 TRINITY_DN4013_c0_g1_i1:52-1305(+)